MKRTDFFPKEASKIKPNEIIDSLNEDTIEVLNEKYLWVSKINDNESGRIEGLRNKAGVLLGLHIGLASLLLSGSFFNLFSEITKNEWGALFAGCITLFIFGSISMGIFYSLKVGGIPRFANVIDPTLSLESYKSTENWLKMVIAETLIVYKKNLKPIGLGAFWTRLSFDFLISATLTTIIGVLVVKTYTFVADKNISESHLVIGGFVGLVLVIIVKYILVDCPRTKKIYGK